MKFPLDWLLLDRWYWITILGCSAVMIGPFLTIYIIILLPGILKAVAALSLIAGWILAGSYKDWAKAKHKEEKPQAS
jgi:uncharacterized protein involved in cysteine biosynthesis